MALYYVKTTGSDITGNGSLATPWASLYKACQMVTTSGNTIYISGGTYLEHNLCSVSIGVSIEGVGTGLTFLQMDYNPNTSYSTSGCIRLYTSAVTYGNQYISNISFDGMNLGVRAIATSNRNNVSIYNCTFNDFVNSPVGFFGTSYEAYQQPTTYITGNSFHDNVVDNCTSYSPPPTGLTQYQGLWFSGQYGFEMYNNIFTTPSPAGISGDLVSSSTNRRWKIYNNTFTKLPPSPYMSPNTGITYWNFALEVRWNYGYCEFYNNDISGVADIPHCFNESDSISLHEHDNIFWFPTQCSGTSYGTTLEGWNYNVLIENNIYKNIAIGCSLTNGTSFPITASNITFRNNLFVNIGSLNSNSAYGFSAGGTFDDTFTDVYFYNNTLIGSGSDHCHSGFRSLSNGTVSNLFIQNNIMTNFRYPVSFILYPSGGTLTNNNVYITNNDFTGNTTSNNIYYYLVGTSGITITGNTTVNPLFVSPTDYRLQSNSTLINAGIDMGQPFTGSAPDIGANETNMYYFSDSTGDDITGNGTIFYPWKTTTKVNSLSFVAGDIVLFKRGDIFVSTDIIYPEVGGVGNPITFGAYGTGNKPILTSYGSLSGWTSTGNWTNISGNIWTLSSTNRIVRLWINGTETTRSFTTGVTSTGIFYHNGTTLLYVYSVGNPASTFSSMECNTLDKIFYCNYGNITFENLDLQSSHNCIRISNGADNFIIDSCNIGWNSDGRGILASNSALGQSIDNIFINNCTFDSNDKMMYPHIEAQSAFAGIAADDGSSNWEIKNCYFKNWGHACLEMGNFNGYYSSNISIHDNYFTCPDIYYGRAIGIGGNSGYVSNVEIYNNIAFSCPTSSEFSSGAVYLHNNVFDNNNRECLITVKNFETGACLQIVNTYNSNPSGMRIHNNVFANAYDMGISFGGYDGVNDYVGLEFINNIVYNNGSSIRYPNWQMYMFDQPCMKGNTFKNNLFYKSGVTDVIRYGNSSINDYPHTVAEFNAENGTDGDIISGNIQLNPLFISTVDFGIQYSSPARNSGIDVGLPYNGTSPAIGAFEYGIYFDNILGNDITGSGTTMNPYKSITKLNSVLVTIITGTTAYLKRGSEWSGTTITPTKSGVSGGPITIDAYGTGENPIITSFQSITGWVPGTTGIYYKALSPQSTPNVVTVDGIDKEIGRFPKNTYLTLDAYTGNTAINCSSLNSTLTGWTGSEVVIRKNRWILDRCTITNHTGSKITYSGGSSYSPYLNFGFFIQNDLKCLTQVGEWAYIGSNFYMYFGGNNPNSYTVKVSVIDKLIDISSKNYLNINNLNLIGANSASINIVSSTYIDVNNCTINFSGDYGIKALTSSNYLSLSGNTVSNCHNHGINIQSNSSNSYVGYNTVTDTELFAGMGKNGDGNGYALTADGDNGLIEYNRVINNGYLGIHWGGNGSNVRYNYVDTFCFVKDDGSGIYTFSNSPNYYTVARLANNNIVLNGVGATGGTTSTVPAVNGLYSDGYSNLLTYDSNTVSNCYLGVHCGFWSRTLTFTNNLFYNNTYQFESTNTVSDVPAYSGSTISPKDFVINNNIFINKSSNQTCVKINDTINNYSMSDIGTWNGNYYINQFSDDNVAYCSYTVNNKPYTVGYSFERWKTDFDINAKNNFPSISKYTINNLGPNLFTNSGFTSNITGLNQNFYWSGNSGISSLTWDGTSKITGTGSAKASIVNLSTGGGNESQTSATLTGGVIAGHNYLVKVKLLGTTSNGTIKTLINSTIWEQYQYISFTNTVQSKEYLLTTNNTSVGGRVYFALNDADGTTYFDDLQIYDVDVTMTNPDDVVLFEYNSGLTNRTISLNGKTYMKPDGSTVSGSIVLLPFTSVILWESVVSGINYIILDLTGKIRLSTSSKLYLTI